jgi:N-acetylmuramoyl-L-alanine amidase
MTTLEFNCRLFAWVLWTFTGLCLLVILTSCTPYQAAAIYAQPVTASPSKAATAQPSPSMTTQSPAPLCADVTALEALNVRSGPGTNNQVIATLAHGDQVTTLTAAGAWWQIRTAQGLTGWANSNFLNSTTCGE